MNRESAEQLIADLYHHALGRAPAAAEYARWVDVLLTGRVEEVVRAFYKSEEYKRKHQVTSVFPAGHYHSPVVDPRMVGDYVRRESSRPPDDLKGIEIDHRSMRELWERNLDVIKETPFAEEHESANRYFYQSGPYPYGDAITLRMMIGHFRPKRIIEIGSGSSSACMLDSADHFGLSDLRLTCIEPYPDRLRSFLRASDEKKVVIVDKQIQEISVDIVDDLQENDFLFIDSTHVLKTGSDVHYELFYLLPRLRPGVIIHFHDVRYPFEYPEQWVFNLNYSWNEAYALRAFLMYNQKFEIIFWGSLLAREYTNKIRAEFPTFLKNPGSAIWLRRVE